MTLVALNRIFKTKYGGAFSKMPDYSVGNTPVIKSLRVVFPAARGVKWEDEQIHTQES